MMRHQLGTMRRVLGTMAMVTVTCAWAEKGALPSPLDGGGRPKLVCDHPEFDFGERDNTEEVRHEFLLRNAGTAPLVLQRVTTSCGCTAAKTTTEPIPPGGETPVVVIFALKGRRGPQSQTVYVDSNDPDQPTLRLTLKGTAVAEVMVEPSYVNFGDLSRDAAVTQAVAVVCRKAGVAITNVVSDTPQFVAEAWPPGDPRGMGFHIRTVPPLPTDHLRAKVTAYLTHPTVPEVAVYVFGIVRGELMVMPREILLRENTVGPVSRIVLVRPGTARVYRIESVECDVPGVKIVTADQGQGTWRVELRDLPVDPVVSGKTVRIRTNLETMREITVPIRLVP